jgi:uncharacterized membrane protein required for colicin V production
MKVGEIFINGFDLLVLIVIAIGIFRGRSRGMSQELLDVLQWLLVVVLGALVYRPFGKAIADVIHISPITGFLLAYISALLLVRVVFGWLKRMVGEKLFGSDIFGNGEYYLGMFAGAVRFGCFLIVGLAILNAPYFTPEQLAAEARMQKENFEDISFPTLGTIQQTVFTGSASGRFAKRYLAHELIVTSASDKTTAPADTMRRREERAISDILGDKPK